MSGFISQDEFINSLDYTMYKSIYAKRTHYYNIPCAFDTESSSFYNNGEKCAITYIWMFGIDDLYTYGRTLDELPTFLGRVAEKLKLSNDGIKLIVYVHNLAFDFQFIRKYLNVEKVFAIESRKVLYFQTDNGYEFRCSYLLSGYSLEKVGENLQRYHVQKLVGDLDYDLIRTPSTPLTDKELQYCLHDILVVIAYIRECIENEGGIGRITLTKTGRVRRYVRKACYNSYNYRRLMEDLTLKPEEFLTWKRAFQGGFTHCSAIKSGKVYKNVASFDFTSSYPSVIVAERYPMTQGEYKEKLTIEDLDITKQCVVFDCIFINIRSSYPYEHYISKSKCIQSSNVKTDNGRLISADMILLTITNIDFEIIKATYQWDNLVLAGGWVYKWGYLPKPIIESTIHFYEQKTTLKGVAGKEVEYLAFKELVNAIYGMMVTSPIKDEQIYIDDEWRTPKAPVLDEALQNYNGSHSRFLFYPWGVIVTAWARYNLWSGILAVGEDYIYSDTDSLKILNKDKHIDYFTRYNESVTRKLEHHLKLRGIDVGKIAPKTTKGVKKPLGVWDYEGTYTRFKSLGAKRYLTEDEDGLALTVAGLGKKKGLAWLEQKSTMEQKDPFVIFADGMSVPPGATGKQTHTYLDEEQRGTITDYRGQRYEYIQRSSVHLESASYDLSISDEYKNLLEILNDEIL